MTASVLTIGHSTHSVSKLINLLRQHSVTAIADVRSQPYSRMNPQFNREPLKDALKRMGLFYVFLGRELGARSEDRSCYIDGKVQYDRIAQTELFQQGIARVIDGAARHRIALLCAEKDPLTCHRTILVVRQLVARGIHASHILDDGRIEVHKDALERLLKEEGIRSDDLFKPRQALLDEACAKRANAIAYVEKSSTAIESASERFAP